MKRSETIAGLQASRQKAIDDAQAIVALGTDTSLTPEQTAEVNGLLDSAESLGAQIEAVAAEEATLAVTAQRIEALRAQPQNRQVAAIVAGGSRMAPMAPGAAPQRWTVPATARKAFSKLTAFSDQRDSGGFTPEESAYHFGQYCLAKASRDLPEVYNFVDATRFAHEHGMLRNAHYEGVGDTTGSHLFVPDEFGSDMIRLREEYGAARQCCKMVQMMSDTRTDPRWVSGLTSYFTGEGVAATESSMVHQQVRLTAKKMTVLSTYSSELNEDSVMDLAQTLASEMAYADALKEDQCFIDGDGTSTYGGIVGLKTQFATTTLGTAPGYRDSTTSNTWAAIVIADLTSLISVVPVYAQSGIKFLCSSQFYYQVMVPLLNAAGGLTGAEMAGGFRGTPTFQGIPVVFSQAMGVATATSTIAVFLGNFAMGASFGDRRRQSIEFSREATIGSVNLFESDMIAIKSSQRIDMNVHSIGSNSAAGPIVALSTGS